MFVISFVNAVVTYIEEKNDGGKDKDALGWFFKDAALVQRCVQPDQVARSAAMAGVSRGADWSGWPQVDIKSYSATWIGCLSSFEKAGLWRGALSLLQLAEDWRLPLDLISYNVPWSGVRKP
eukprot:s333_g22.t1